MIKPLEILNFTEMLGNVMYILWYSYGNPGNRGRQHFIGNPTHVWSLSYVEHNTMVP